MSVSCICRTLPLQNILCSIKPRFVSSLKYNPLCAHTCSCSNLKSLLVSLAQPLPIAKVYLLPLMPTAEKQTFSLRGEKTESKATHSTQFLAYIVLSVERVGKSRQAQSFCAWVPSPEAWLKLCILAAPSQEPLLKCSVVLPRVSR